MPVSARLTLYRGEAYEITDTVSDDAGAAEDVTGWTLAATLKQRAYDADAALELTVGDGIAVPSPVTGEVVITMTAAQTLALAGSRYLLEVWRTDPGQESLLTRAAVDVCPTTKPVP